ncbi:MAG: phage virion morphogenesis protein [Candidatus Methylacidiphilales bacterium]
MENINPAPNFEAIGRNLIKQLPHNIGQMALSHFKGSFRKQGFTDYSYIAWPLRKDLLTHKLMVKSNSLMNDLKVTSQTMQRVELGTTLPYAAIHNNGGKFSILLTPKMRKFFWAMFYKTNNLKYKQMALTKKKRLPVRIPQRHFIGNSAVLNQNIDKYITNEIIKQFNQA